MSDQMSVLVSESIPTRIRFLGTRLCERPVTVFLKIGGMVVESETSWLVFDCLSDRKSGEGAEKGQIVWAVPG